MISHVKIEHMERILSDLKKHGNINVRIEVSGPQLDGPFGYFPFRYLLIGESGDEYSLSPDREGVSGYQPTVRRYEKLLKE